MAAADTRRTLVDRSRRPRSALRSRHYPCDARRAALARWPTARASPPPAPCAGARLLPVPRRPRHAPRRGARGHGRAPAAGRAARDRAARARRRAAALPARRRSIGAARRRPRRRRAPVSALAACCSRSSASALLGRALFGPSRASSRRPDSRRQPGRALLRRLRAHVLAVPGVHALALWCLVRALDDGRTLVGRRRRPARAERLRRTPTASWSAIAAGAATLVATAQTARRRRLARAAARPARGVVAGTLPLAVGVPGARLASRRGATRRRASPCARRRRSTPCTRRSRTSSASRAPMRCCRRPASTRSPPPRSCSSASCSRRRRDPAHGVLLGLLLVLPPLVIAVVQVPGTDNHVRYVIEALPALLVCLAYGAVELAGASRPTARGRGRRRAGDRAPGRSTSCAGDTCPTTATGASTRPPHDTRSTAQRSGCAHSFARNDLVFGYDPVVGERRAAPGRQRVAEGRRAARRARKAR